MRPPGFHRDVRPWHDLRELGGFLTEYTKARVYVVLALVLPLVLGVGAVAADNLWGVPLLIGGLALIVAVAWVGYYRFEEPRDGSELGKHSRPGPSARSHAGAEGDVTHSDRVGPTSV